METTRSRYARLKDQVTGTRSVDYGRATIYVFKKYCRHCGKGLEGIKRHTPRVKKRLWRKSFCTNRCEELGRRHLVESSVTVKAQTPAHKNEHTVEEVAFLGVQLHRANQARAPIAKLVYEAEENFRLQSEKLRFLEVMTGDTWYPSRYYYWLQRL